MASMVWRSKVMPICNNSVILNFVHIKVSIQVYFLCDIPTVSVVNMRQEQLNSVELLLMV
jgi:hypothetical protein